MIGAHCRRRRQQRLEQVGLVVDGVAEAGQPVEHQVPDAQGVVK